MTTRDERREAGSLSLTERAWAAVRERLTKRDDPATGPRPAMTPKTPEETVAALEARLASIKEETATKQARLTEIEQERARELTLPRYRARGSAAKRDARCTFLAGAWIRKKAEGRSGDRDMALGRTRNFPHPGHEIASFSAFVLFPSPAPLPRHRTSASAWPSRAPLSASWSLLTIPHFRSGQPPSTSLFLHTTRPRLFARPSRRWKRPSPTRPP